METLSPVEQAVLEVTAQAPENLERVYQRVHLPPQSASLWEAARAIARLLDQGLIRSTSEDASAREQDPGLGMLFQSCFEATAKGQGYIESEMAQRRPAPRRSLAGIWKDRNIKVTREDIDEVRREMWANFPRDAPK